MRRQKFKLEQTPLYDAAKKVARRIGPGKAFFAGGAIRDSYMGWTIKDIDIATELGPKQVMCLFPGSELIGADFGVVLVKMDGFAFEVATFRVDGKYLDLRRPISVTFGTMRDDVKRRDFTGNALFYDPFTEEIIDLVGGLDDLDRDMLRCVGDPMDRFSEDALRILRAIRFHNKITFFDPDLVKAAKTLAPNLLKISAERVRDELTKTFMGHLGHDCLNVMKDWGILHVLLPEIANLMNCKQSPIHHPEGDVFFHTLLVLKNIKPKDPIHVWTALLHDIAKPVCFKKHESFHGHAEMGAEMANDILTRLRFPNDDKKMIVSAVRDHMKFLDITKMRRSRLRRFMSEPHFELAKNLHRADCLASTKNFTALEYLDEKAQEFIKDDGAVLPDPLITGYQVMEYLGIKQGPQVGKILNRIREAQLDGMISTEKEAFAHLDALLNYHEKELT